MGRLPLAILSLLLLSACAGKGPVAATKGPEGPIPLGRNAIGEECLSLIHI